MSTTQDSTACTTYRVVDGHTHSTVRLGLSFKAADRAAERMNLAYGAHRYSAQREVRS